MTRPGGGTTSSLAPLRLAGYGGPPLAWAGLLFYLSSLPSFPDTVPSFEGFDKLAHFGAYFVLGGLLCRFFSAFERFGSPRRRLLWTILVGVAYGLGDEWHQSFVPGRDPSLSDLLFDAAGVAAAAATWPDLRTRWSAIVRNLRRG